MELLGLALPGEGAAIVDDLPVIAEGRAHGVRDLRPRHADAEGFGGLESGDGVPGEAGHAAQAVRPGGDDPRRGAEHLQQAVGERSGVAGTTAPGQQKFQQLAVVDGRSPGAQEAGLEPAAAGGRPDTVADRGRRRRQARERHVGGRHVAEARSGRVGRAHAAISRTRAARVWH